MIIALTGLAGSGKSTVAEMLGGVHIAFAEPLKKFCAEVFGFTHEELYGPSEARERPSSMFTRPDGTPLTPRFALQTLGTEWGRNCDPDVWAKAGVARAVEMRTALGRHGEPVIITDLRFVNEARLVREAGGYVWRIDRPGLTRGNHSSELDIWSKDMDALVTADISNTGTLNELRGVIGFALLGL